ncbi:MAG: 50S ribosome-binding GTPase [Deltaproteobacteria bacterium]|nr:50S ribosome-binding GTPase [Deltaproteobacteria bacterium]
MSSQLLRIVITGHVDHGKSTLIGRLFYDTGSLAEERYREIRLTCEKQGRPFEFAFLTDALEEERVQNVTIDTAQSFFKSARRPYVIIDAPGHKEFLKNMVTGAAAADAAVLLVDGAEGVREQTRRHAYLLSLLGLEQVVVAVNKLDLVGWRQEAFEQVEAEVRALLGSLKLTPSFVVPCSAREGDNIAQRSRRMPWYPGPTILEALDRFEPKPAPEGLPLRFPVQDVYALPGKRIYVGRVETGTLRRGDSVVLAPSGKRSRVATIERFGSEGAEGVERARCGEAVGLTFADELFVERGEVVGTGEPAIAAAELRASLFWLGQRPLALGGQYLLKLGTAEVEARVTAIEERIDCSTLEVLERSASKVEAPEAATVLFELRRPIAAEPFESNPLLGRFVVVDGGFVAGGGIVREARTQAGSAGHVVSLEMRLRAGPHGNVVDLTTAADAVEFRASSAFVSRLQQGERVQVLMRGLHHTEALMRFAFQHHLDLHLSRSAQGGASAVLGGSEPGTRPRTGEAGP